MPRMYRDRDVQRAAKRAAGDLDAPTSALRGKDYASQVAMLAPVQGYDGALSGGAQEIASQGVAGSGGKLPYADKIQQSFGRHDIGAIQAYTGSNATRAAKAMSSRAYATGNQVAFAGQPSLHTAAHEAAHVVQQRAGVHLKGGVGRAGDAYEQHADKVADKVVAGQSAEGLLDTMNPSRQAASSARAPAIQRDHHVEGHDPLADFDDDQGDVLYGLSPYRGVTQGRMDDENPDRWAANKPKTIDVYNRKAGINALMGAGTSAYGLFKVREALEGDGAWPLENTEDMDQEWMQAWIAKLRANSRKIGLYDLGNQTKTILGTRKGKEKIKKKHRLTKNVDEDKADDLDAKRINKWLAPGKTYEEARDQVNDWYGDAATGSMCMALNQWIYKAFFRRTSKLGIDFIAGDRGARVHFNTATSMNYLGLTEEERRVHRDGVGRKSRRRRSQHNNRSITVSEYRHAKKRMRKGRIPRNRINMYGEWND